jgi:CHAT domain-containing protein/tetratricopeptide (TPR) repeat protein
MSMRARAIALRFGLAICFFTVSPAAFGQSPGDADIKAMNRSVNALYQAGQYAAAIPLAKRAVEAVKSLHGDMHPEYAMALNNLGQLFQAMNRLAEAEPLYRRALAIDEKSFRPDDPKLAHRLYNLAKLLQDMYRFAEAEQLYRSALAIDEKNSGRDDPGVAASLSNLAQLLLDANRVAEAEQLMHRALAIDEKWFGFNPQNVAADLNNLAQLLEETNRFAEAEPLMRRALAIDEGLFGPDHNKVAPALDNLAMLLVLMKRSTEAEPLVRRALAIDEKSFGPGDPKVAHRLNNLAALLQTTNRLSEAEPLVRRALAIDEKSFGPSHPMMARDLGNLAMLLGATNRLAEAEPLMRRALAIDEKNFGPKHIQVAGSLIKLAGLAAEQGHWSAAVTLHAQAKPIVTGIQWRGEMGRSSHGKAILARSSEALRAHARPLYHADARKTENRAEGFELEQWAVQSSAADALSSMASRFAKGDEALAQLVREQQDLAAAHENAYRRLDAAAGKADAKAAEAVNAEIAEIERRLAEKQAQLRKAFPDYANFSDPRPLSLADAQELLGDQQALVVFLDMWRVGNVPEETIVFALTKKDVQWLSVPLGTQALLERVAALRCGLDKEGWEGIKEMPCQRVLGVGKPGDGEPLPFNLGIAHELYQELLHPFEKLIEGKQLLIVPSGALTSLPFQVLVTKEPPEALPKTYAGYRGAAWLGRRQPLSVLPSVASLKGLRKYANRSRAPKAYAAWGNPKLDGNPGCPKQEEAPLSCANGTKPASSAEVRTNRSRPRTRSWDAASIFAKGASLEAVRGEVLALCPLPDTASEIACVSQGQPDPRVMMGEQATVADIETLNGTGELGKYRIVHFATHGLLAGDVQDLAKRQGEAALVLTPASMDTGLLETSEIAQLSFNADWVILSACNTAASDKPGAEALSGLARAFFYAGARALLVSHWPVYSDAAASLITGSFDAMGREKSIGKAEALRLAMIALMDDTSQEDNPHPSVWAPFVLAGDGGR